jgi:UPF0755 protein
MRSPFAKLSAGVFLFLTLLLGYQALSFGLFAVSPARKSVGAAPAQVVIEVRKGMGAHDISAMLASQGVIADTGRFIWVGKLTRQWGKIKAGEYGVTPAMSPVEILGVITSGISIPHPITVREGENMYQIADDLEAKGLATRARFLEICRDVKFMEGLGIRGAPSLEGYLFPDTYFFNKTISPEDMARQMVRHFLSVWTPELEAGARALGLNRHQLVTLASIVEKETGAPQERPLISSVFHNRLRKRMRIQSDPTTIYGIWERYEGNIHRSDLLTPSPYNTYTLPALPIGPISNPGREALAAAIHPAQSPYLFFVSHNDGTHEFTANLAAHNAAVQKFQIDPRAREGKSWRDLNKPKTGN